MNTRGRRSRNHDHDLPQVLVVGAPFVADMLFGDPTIVVHPHVWTSLATFVDDAADRRIALDGPFVVCVAPDSASGDVTLDEFLALFRDVTVLVHPQMTLPQLYEAIAGCLDGSTPAIDLTAQEASVPGTEWRFERPAARSTAPAVEPERDALIELLGDNAFGGAPFGAPSPGDLRPSAPVRPDGARPAARPPAPIPPAPETRRTAPDENPLLAGLDIYTSGSTRAVDPTPVTEPSPAPPPTAPAAPNVTARRTDAGVAPAIPPAVRPPDPSYFTGTHVPPPRQHDDPFAHSVRDVLGPDTRPMTEYDVSSTRIIAVYSPKGGVGKTSIAVNLAARLAHTTRLSVCIVDLDIGFGNVGTRLGVFTPTIRKLLVEPELDQEALARNLAYDEHSGLHALLAPLRPEAGADRKLLKPAVYDKILALLVDRFDVVFLDCSVELNDPLVSQFALKRAHEVVVVVNNEQATLLDARRAIEAMIRPTDAPRVPGLGLDLDHIKIVLNQNVEGVGKDLAQIHTLLTGDDPAHPLNGVPIVSVIPDDRKLWVGHANLARPVATAGVPEIDQAFDQALGAVMDGAARYDSATRPDNAYASFDAAPRRDDADLKSAGLFGRFRRRKD